MLRKPFYITTSIAYPTADPHLGYALELAQADILTRYYKTQGEAYLLTGTDEHGLKLERAAAKAGCTPQVFVDQSVEPFKRLVSELRIEADRFIRTTDADHEAMAQALWERCSADIYKRQYQAWYDVKEEEFLGTVEEFPDPSVYATKPEFIERIDEENYFFALSKYKEQILTALEGAYQIIPEHRAQELRNFVAEHGLEDISISRSKERLSWGIPVPGDESQVMYVWFDALTNYLTAAAEIVDGEIVLGERWPGDIHIVGKDISRFHALIWVGMLLSAEIPLPKQLIIHGFINDAHGQKMSKSIGNVIEPFSLIERYGADAVRWYITHEISTTGDANFSNTRMDEVYQADLSNTVGNLVSRVLTMVNKYQSGVVTIPTFDPFDTEHVVSVAWVTYHAAMADRALNKAADVAFQVCDACNKLVETEKPWLLAKDPEQADRLQALLYSLVHRIITAGQLLRPYMPSAAETLLTAYGANKSDMTEGASLAHEVTVAGEAPILFPRLVPND